MPPLRSLLSAAGALPPLKGDRLSTRTIAYLIGAADAEDEESLRDAAESMTPDDVMELARCTANLLQHTGTTMAWLLAMAEHD